MENNKELSKEIVLEDVISQSVKLPGVKVNRNKLLAELFTNTGKNIKDIIDLGPVECGFTSEELSKIASKLIIKRTSQSSAASFVAGIPGGIAMAATIPADIMQFFGMALRLAQELSYIYGAEDLWVDGQVDDEKVKSQLILYCGVMFGVSGAVSGVRVLTTQIAKTAAKKIPQKALTKTFWYPIVKQIGKAIGVKITKNTVAKGVSKAVPILGGVISGGLNFASMMPMANRLQQTFDTTAFHYTEEELNADIEELEKFAEYEEIDDEPEGIKEKAMEEVRNIGSKVSSSIKNVGSQLSGITGKFSNKVANEPVKADPYEEIKKMKELLDMGIITQEEFDKKKSELLGL